MSTKSKCKIAAVLSLLVLYGTAQGMLEVAEKDSWQDIMLQGVKEISQNILKNPQEYAIIAGVAGIFGVGFGAGVTKLFSTKSNGEIPRAPSLHLSKKEETKKEANPDSEVLKVPVEKVRQALGIVENNVVPENWFELIQQSKRKLTQPTRVGAVRSSELKLKQYEKAINDFLKSKKLPKPHELVDALQRKERRAVGVVKRGAQIRMLKLKLAIMKQFGDTSKKISEAGLEDFVTYLKGKLPENNA